MFTLSGSTIFVHVQLIIFITQRERERERERDAQNVCVWWCFAAIE